jgi:phospholipid/cholesterol/gamma-HCH transport system substrate-binding protein
MMKHLRALRKRPITSYNKIWLGSIALGLVAVTIAVVLLIGALDLGRTRYQAEFAQAADLRSGDQVTIAGVSVGTVEGLALAGDRVLVKFKVRNDVPLGRDTHAAIKLTTLLGNRYLELSPAGSGTLARGTIELANTAVPYNLQDALADATTTFDAVDADRIASSLTTISQSLTGVPEALPDALSNLRALAGIISDRRDQLRTLLSSADKVTAMIRDQKTNLGSLIVQGRNLLGDLASRRAALERLFTSATALVATLSRVLGDQPGLDDLLAGLRDFSHMIASHDAQFRSLLQALPIPMRNFANAFGSGTAGDVALPAGILVDSWMCAISGRATQFNLVEYFKDCQ